MLAMMAWGLTCSVFPDTPPIKARAGSDDGGSRGVDGDGSSVTESSGGTGGQETEDAELGGNAGTVENPEAGGTGGAPDADASGSGGSSPNDASSPDAFDGNDTGGSAGEPADSGPPVNVTVQVAAKDDDANEEANDFAPSAVTVWLGTGSSVGKSYAGLRFDNLPIPKGAQIQEAHIQLNVSSTSSSKIAFTLFAEDTDSCVSFTDKDKISKRTAAPGETSVTLTEQWLTGEWKTIEGLAAAIQGTVNRSGWKPGNALCVIAKGQGTPNAQRSVMSYNGSPTLAAKLFVTYVAR